MSRLAIELLFASPFLIKERLHVRAGRASEHGTDEVRPEVLDMLVTRPIALA